MWTFFLGVYTLYFSTTYKHLLNEKNKLKQELTKK